MEPLLKVVDLTKKFGDLPVINNVCFEVHAGEVLGVAGRSGAGKTTLVMVLAGLQSPSEGEIYLSGKRLHMPFKARKLGIEVLHQTPELVPSMDIGENIFMGNEIGWPTISGGKIISSQKRMDDISLRVLNQLDISFPNLREKVINLSGGQRQMLSVARAMVKPAKLMVVDDVTEVLNYPHQKKVLALIETWRQEGRGVVFFSDNLDHLFAVTDKIMVLCDNFQVAKFETDKTSREEVVAALVGTTDQQQITPFIWALDNFYRARERAEELRHNQTLLERDLAAQDTLNKQLINQLNKQIIALDKINQALQDAHRRLLTKDEEDRKSLARELHDETIQDLLSVNYELEAIEENEDLDLAIDEKLKNIRFNIRELIENLRDTCRELRPPTIDALGLGAAITSFANEWSAKHNINLQIEIGANLIRMPEATELSIYRIVQEALRNIDKHSNATRASLHLWHNSSRSIMLTIIDDGIGLPKNFTLSTLAKQGHFGLLGISERVALLGGNLSIENNSSGGVIIQAEIPHPRTIANQP